MAFNDVTYGETPGTPAAHQTIVDLDDHLRFRSAAGRPGLDRARHSRLVGTGSMTVANSVIPVRRRRSWRWVLLVLAADLRRRRDRHVPDRTTSGRADGPRHRLDLTARTRWSPLLRDHGVTVVVANSVDEAESAAAPRNTAAVRPDPARHQRFTASPAGRHVGRSAAGRADLARPRRARPRYPQRRRQRRATPSRIVLCAKRTRLDRWTSGRPTPYSAVGDRAVTSCYGGALVRYRDGERTVTVVGSTDFMTNGGLLRAGNAALAMNLAGQHLPPGVVRTAAHRR